VSQSKKNLRQNKSEGINNTKNKILAENASTSRINERKARETTFSKSKSLKEKILPNDAEKTENCPFCENSGTDTYNCLNESFFFTTTTTLI